MTKRGELKNISKVVSGSNKQAKNIVKELYQNICDDVYLAEWVDNLVKTRESYLNANSLNPKFADYECFLTLDENMSDNKLLKFYKLNTKRELSDFKLASGNEAFTNDNFKDQCFHLGATIAAGLDANIY